MINDLFQPHDVKPKWALVVDFIQTLPPGEAASLEGLAHVADTKPSNIPSLVTVINKKMVADGFRLVAVGNRGGYRVATPADCIQESAGRRPRWILRGVRRAKQAAVAATRNPAASPEERKMADEIAAVHRDHERIARTNGTKLRVARPEMPVVRPSADGIAS